MRQLIKMTFLFSLFSFALVAFTPQLVFAQSEEAREQREAEYERRAEEREEMLRMEREETPKTADEVLEMLKKRVAERKAEQRRKDLLKTSFSASITQIFETNPNSSNSVSKDDPSLEHNFTANWLPKFNNTLNGNLGISFTNLRYNDNPALGTRDKTLTADVTYRTLKGKLSLNPGGSYQWMDYPKADSSSYTQRKNFMKFTHYFNKDWNFGGQYEHAYKRYTAALARDDFQNDLAPEIKRVETRHTIDLWVKRYIGKYNLKLKAKSYRNKGNDEYQDFYDYDAHKGEITFAGSFLKGNKLYMSYKVDFEVKQYFDRVAVDTARNDRVASHTANINYTLPKSFKLKYTYTFKESSSNVSSGEFLNSTNKLGVSYSF